MTMTMTAPTPHVLDNAPAPGTDEWTATVTASKVPPMALNAEGEYAGFGYLTAWQTFELLKGRYVETFNDFMLKKFAEAHAAEQDAAEWWIQQQERPEDWMLSAGEVAFTHPGYVFNGRHPIATIDRVATHLPTGYRVGLEVKRPDTMKTNPGWIIQTICQHEWSDVNENNLIIWPADTGVLVLPIKPTRAQVDNLMGDIAAFCERLDNDDEPANGEVILTDDIVAELAAAKEALAAAEERVATIQQRIADTLGQHKRALHNGKAIAYRVSGRFAQGRVPDEYKHLLKDEKYRKTAFDQKKFAKDHPEAYAAALGDSSITFK